MNPRIAVSLAVLYTFFSSTVHAAGSGGLLATPSEPNLMLILGSCLVALAGYSRRRSGK